jgi:hypothetical protein
MPKFPFRREPLGLAAADFPTPDSAAATSVVSIAASVMPALTTTATGSLPTAAVAATTSDITAFIACASDPTVAAAADVPTPSARPKLKARS